MKPAFSEQEEIERLYPQYPMHTLLLLIAASTCLLNPSQSCGTSSACSLMRTRLSWIPRAEVVAHCERQSRLARRIYLELKSTETSLNEPTSCSEPQEG